MADKKKERKSKPRKDKTKKKQSKKTKTPGLVRYSNKAPPRTRRTGGRFGGSITSYGPTDYSDMVNIRNHQARQLNLRNQTLDSNSREMARYKERLDQLEKRGLEVEAQHKKKENTWEELAAAHRTENVRLQGELKSQRDTMERLRKAEALGVTQGNIDNLTKEFGDMEITQKDILMDTSYADLKSLNLPNELDEAKKENKVLQERLKEIEKFNSKDTEMKVEDNREKKDTVTNDIRETVEEKKNDNQLLERVKKMEDKVYDNIKPARVATDGRSAQQQPVINIYNNNSPNMGNVTVDQSTKKKPEPLTPPGVVAEPEPQRQIGGVRTEPSPPQGTTSDPKDPEDPEVIILSGSTRAIENESSTALVPTTRGPSSRSGAPFRRQRNRILDQLYTPYQRIPQSIRVSQEPVLAIENGPSEHAAPNIHSGPTETNLQQPEEVQGEEVVRIRKQKTKVDTDIGIGKKQKTKNDEKKFAGPPVLSEEQAAKMSESSQQNPGMGPEVDPRTVPTFTEELDARFESSAPPEEKGLIDHLQDYVQKQNEEANIGIRKRRKNPEYTGKFQRGQLGERRRVEKNSLLGRVTSYILGQDTAHQSSAMNPPNNLYDSGEDTYDYFD